LSTRRENKIVFTIVTTFFWKIDGKNICLTHCPKKSNCFYRGYKILQEKKVRKIFALHTVPKIRLFLSPLQNFPEKIGEKNICLSHCPKNQIAFTAATKFSRKNRWEKYLPYTLSQKSNCFYRGHKIFVVIQVRQIFALQTVLKICMGLEYFLINFRKIKNFTKFFFYIYGMYVEIVNYIWRSTRDNFLGFLGQCTQV
jgi:hypothetical protein